MTTLTTRSITPTAPPTADWVGFAAAAWATGYGALALIWTVTGHGFPFGSATVDNNASLLRSISPALGAPLFAGILLATAAVMLAMADRRGVRLRGAPRLLLLGFGWTVAAFFVAGAPTMDLLALTGYAPMIIIGAPFGWPPDVPYAMIFDWSLANQAIAMVGGLLVAATTRAWQRRSRAACASCGRAGEQTAKRWSPVRVGRWATGVAVAVPLAYAGTRYAWLAGIPLGVSDRMLRDLHDSGAVWAGGGLATGAVAGAVLTLGLVQRWGEVFPRWMPWLRGRRGPIKLAVIPPAYVTASIMPGGVGRCYPPRHVA